jgi:hypothetical protein
MTLSSVNLRNPKSRSLGTMQIEANHEIHNVLPYLTDRCAETINYLHTQFGLLKERVDKVWLLP